MNYTLIKICYDSSDRKVRIMLRLMTWSLNRKDCQMGNQRLLSLGQILMQTIIAPTFFLKHRPSGPMLSISRNVHLSVCVSVRLFTFEVPFKRLFAPTSQSRVSKIFRDSESLGKQNGKKWSQIWTFLFGSGLKLLRKREVCFFVDFAVQNLLKTTLPDGWGTSGQRVYR